MRDHRRGAFSKSKIVSLPELKKRIRLFRKKGKRIAFTNGCFDLLHYGHVRYLEEAARQADKLAVGINSDGSVRRIKGELRPLVKESDRAGIIAGLESVDFVVIFHEDTPLKLIEALKPDVLVKGADWGKADIVGADIVESYGGKVTRIRLLEGRSTTNIVKKIAKKIRKRKH